MKRRAEPGFATLLHRERRLSNSQPMALFLQTRPARWHIYFTGIGQLALLPALIGRFCFNRWEDRGVVLQGTIIVFDII
jgi:hypothetical protein